MFLYFDPGLGALIVQALIAVFAGVALFYRSVIAKIKSLFGIKKAEDDIFEGIDVDNKPENPS